MCIRDRLLLVCERGTQKSGKVRKYYLIDPNEEIKEINSYKVLEILETKDKNVHPIPSDRDKLVAIGWKKFIEDTEQIKARASSMRLSTTQRWVLEKLLKMSDVKNLTEKKEMIETLRQAYSKRMR